jgi:hypothetical protein
MNPALTFPASDRFVMALAGLCAAVAARIRGGAMSGVMILLVCRRVRRIEGRILRLLARFRAGELPGKRVASGGRHSGVIRARPVSPEVRLPRGFGWLLPLVPCEAANFSSQLRLALAEPEMAGLLAASPGARRVLRPLCRMLAIEPAVLMPAQVDGAAALASPLVAVWRCHGPEPGFLGSSSEREDWAPDGSAIRDG